jgi:hypothetical protein
VIAPARTAICSECGRRVDVDHVAHSGRIVLVWHRDGAIPRCPGTDKPGVAR